VESGTYYFRLLGSAADGPQVPAVFQTLS